MKTKTRLLSERVFITLVLVIAVVSLLVGKALAAWPTRPIDFVISAGTGGGPDLYARFMVGLNIKNKYTPEGMLLVNRTGGARAVAMNYVLKQKGNDHMILIALNSFVAKPSFKSNVLYVETQTIRCLRSLRS